MALGACRTRWRERPPHRPPSTNWLLLFFFTRDCPVRKGDLVPSSLYLFWNNLEFLVGLYHWYRRVKKSRIFNTLSFYFNYLSTVTLIYSGNIQYIDVASHDQSRCHTLQLDFPLSEYSLNCTTECLREPGSKGKPRNSGVNAMEPELGRLPPAGAGPSGMPVLFLSLFLGRCPREKCYTDRR